MDNQQINVLKIICLYVNSNIEDYNEKSFLGSDFGLDGDDAKEVLNEIQKKLKLDISKLDFEKYFNNEVDCNLFSSIIQFFKVKGKEDLSIEELIKICIS